MKKKILIVFGIVLFVLILSILTYEKHSIYDNFTEVETSKNPHFFGEITSKDSVEHKFEIKNITNTLLVIDKVLPSCPCTKVKFDKKKCIKGEIVTVSVKYKPTLKQKGNVKTLVFVQCNAENGIIKLIMTGKIKNK